MLILFSNLSVKLGVKKRRVSGCERGKEENILTVTIDKIMKIISIGTIT